VTDDEFDDHLAALAAVHDPDESNTAPGLFLGTIEGKSYYLFKDPEGWATGIYEQGAIDDPTNTDIVHIDDVEYHDGPHLDREYTPPSVPKKVYLPSLDTFDDAVAHLLANWEAYVREYHHYQRQQEG
jgi:hypothetical protein